MFASKYIIDNSAGASKHVRATHQREWARGPLVDDEFKQMSVIRVGAAERRNRAEGFNVTNPPSHHAYAFFVLVCVVVVAVSRAQVCRISECVCAMILIIITFPLFVCA